MVSHVPTKTFRTSKLIGSPFCALLHMLADMIYSKLCTFHCYRKDFKLECHICIVYYVHVNFYVALSERHKPQKRTENEWIV